MTHRIGERSACFFGVLVHQVGADPGLHSDHSQRVGHDVVNLAGHVQPLVKYLRRGCLDAFTVGSPGIRDEHAT